MLSRRLGENVGSPTPLSGVGVGWGWGGGGSGVQGPVLVARARVGHVSDSRKRTRTALESYGGACSNGYDLVSQSVFIN